MEQMSFFSAGTTRPGLADLAGVLCGPGQLARSGDAAVRLSVVVAQPWRADVLAEEFECRGVPAEVSGVGTSESDHRLVRTPFRDDLLELARQFSRGAMKALPADFRLASRMLRLWVVTCGRPTEGGYLLPLDRRAPDTHRPLLTAFTQVGLPGRIVGPRGGGPAVRISGRKRLTAFAEMLGEPRDAARNSWPGAHIVSRVG